MALRSRAHARRSGLAVVPSHTHLHHRTGPDQSTDGPGQKSAAALCVRVQSVFSCLQQQTPPTATKLPSPIRFNV